MVNISTNINMVAKKASNRRILYLDVDQEGKGRIPGLFLDENLFKIKSIDQHLFDNAVDDHKGLSVCWFGDNDIRA